MAKTVTENVSKSSIGNNDLTVVGRIASAKEISAHTIKANLLRLLQPVKGCSFQNLGPNKFALHFNHKLDLEHAMSGTPWVLDHRNAVLLQKAPVGACDADLRETTVNLMTIVVRIHRLPMKWRNTDTALLIGNKLGTEVEALTNRKDGEYFVEYVRVKVRLDIIKPLKRGMFLRETDGSRNWVSFTYERLPNFCFLCGIVGHGESRCTLRYEEDFVDPGENLPYGSWLRASVGNSGLPLQAIRHAGNV